VIDERTLQAAHDAMLECAKIQIALGRTDLMEMAQVAVEAYEAVKWRPIEEAPRDGREILIWHRSEAWVVFYDPPYWLIGSSEHSFQENELEGAVFRPIYPPQTNASKSSS